MNLTIKRFCFSLFLALLTANCFAQKTIALKNLWTRPQMHVSFNGYTISFAIRDINRALELLNETGEYMYGTKCTLDTSGNYFIELFDVSKPEYKTLIEPLIQNGVGSFLLTVGKAVIEDPKHKIMPNVELSIEGGEFSSEYYQIQVFDPKTKKLIYSGRMNTAMYNKDMGIDYY